MWDELAVLQKVCTDRNFGKEQRRQINELIF